MPTATQEIALKRCLELFQTSILIVISFLLSISIFGLVIVVGTLVIFFTLGGFLLVI